MESILVSTGVVALAEIGVADDADLPFLDGGVRVGADGDSTFGGGAGRSDARPWVTR